MVVNTWNDACAQALQELHTEAENSSAAWTSSDIEAGLDIVTRELAEYVRNGRGGETIVLAAMRSASTLAIKELDRLGYIVGFPDLHRLLCRKQHDYGHQNIDNFGMIGVAVRLCDKIARAKNLKHLHYDGFVQDETIVDTYTDIIGYATIALMLDANTFSLQLADDYV